MTNINTFQGDVFIHEYIKHTGDDNNLFGFSGTDTFKIATGGTDRLVVGSDGNVTITNAIIIPDYIYHTGDLNNLFGFSGTDSFKIATNGVDRLTINSSGTVTIAGTLTATGQVKGATVVGTHYGTISGSNAAAFSTLTGTHSGTHIGTHYGTISGSNAATVSSLTATGNVGIGTANPVGVNGGQRLEGSSSTGFEYIATRDDTTGNSGDFVGAYLFKNLDTAGTEPHYAGMSSKLTGTNGPMDLRFHTNRNNYEADIPQMIIDADGNVGIGKTNPGATLDVVGDVAISSNLAVDTNTLFVDSVGNKVGIGTTSPGSALHVVGDVNVVSNVNMLHTSNTASIKLNSNVVVEFPRSTTKFMKFPRLLLTYAAQSSQGGYENYIVNQSSAYSTESNSGAYIAFRGNEHWLSASNSFDGGDDVFNGTNGPWISIQLPTKIKLEYLEFSAASGRLNQLIAAGSVYASNDGSTWINIGSLDNLGTYTNFVPAHVDFTHTTLYDRYLLHITANATLYVHMEKLSLYGTPEYDPEADGVDVVVKSVPNVPNTDWLEVYYDAKDLADGSTTVNDLKPVGTANNGVANGNLSVTDGAFVFDGSGDYISSTVTTTTGAFVHTFAFWMNIPSSSPTDSSLVAFGTNSSDEASVIRFDGAEIFRWYFFGNDIKFTTPNVRDKWVHVVATYDGGNDSGLTVGNVGVNRKIFINTKETTVIENVSGSAGSDALNLVSTSHAFRVGSSLANGELMVGKIANVRLFNRVLTTDEIYQLYAYQKEDFGHGVLGMTLKNGRLGIGTSEPKAMLDVRGDILGGNPAAFSVAYNPTALSGNQTIIWNLVYHNVGGAYDSSNGLFTAPVSGYYHFTVWGMTSGNTSGVIELQFQKNGSTVQQRPYSQGVNNYGHVSGTIIEYLSVGDTMKVFLTTGTTLYAASAQSYNGFSGFYLSS